VIGSAKEGAGTQLLRLLLSRSAVLVVEIAGAHGLAYGWLTVNKLGDASTIGASRCSFTAWSATQSSNEVTRVKEAENRRALPVHQGEVHRRHSSYARVEKGVCPIVVLSK
jgi:hypothetical protein